MAENNDINEIEDEIEEEKVKKDLDEDSESEEEEEEEEKEKEKEEDEKEKEEKEKEKKKDEEEEEKENKEINKEEEEENEENKDVFEGGKKSRKRGRKNNAKKSTKKNDIPKDFMYKCVETKTTTGGAKTVRKVAIKNGKGYKSISHFKNGKKEKSTRKKICYEEMCSIQVGKFIPGLFDDCKCVKSSKRMNTSV